MNISDYNSILPLAAAGFYTIIFVALIIKGTPSPKQNRWMFLILGISLVWEFSLFFPRPSQFPNLPTSLLIVATGCLAFLTADYINWKPHIRWLLIAGGAIGAIFAIELIKPNETILISQVSFSISQALTIFTWMALHGLLIIKTISVYRRTKFPWHANRVLFWLLLLFIIFISEAFLLMNGAVVATIGQALRLVGLMGAAYAISSYRIFDVRTRSQELFAFLIINALSALPLATAIVVVQQFSETLTQIQTAILMGGIIVLGFFLYQPYRNSIERWTYRYVVGEGVDTSRMVRKYSQAISRTLDMQQLSLLIIGTLSELLETNRGALMLVTKQEDDSFDVEPIPAMGRISRQIYNFSSDSAFIHTLTRMHQPLLQYDIDFNPDFESLREESQIWLKEQSMEAYVPIIASSDLVGIIGIGPKGTAVPYQPYELELVQILADQTVVALQNARLYSELGNQNAQIRDLNHDLVDQNERLEIMDRVKSDFITIASHELRTPLTQVKGYTDILSAMNEENALTREQTREIVGHVNRATLQLESLITAMLDASQLDVDGMQLTFVKTQMDTILRLAIEPITQAIRERQISVLMEGVEELPSLYADFKRLVQAFTNIIGNAVKYTPDHGSISIEAKLIPSQDNENDHIEIVITDSGIGIDSKFHDLIFEKFFRIGDPQLHSTGSTKFKGAGPGLGLPIARGVIEAHHGQIWVESEGEDEQRLPGTRFYVTIPVKPANAQISDPNGRNKNGSQQDFQLGKQNNLP